jgi:hypothetical protein
MGWSRPWNKYNVVNFQSFKLNAGDRDLCQLTMAAIDAEVLDMPEDACRFVAELMTGSLPPMGFVFFQELTERERRYEGAVVSYGRVNRENKRFRDRMDVILESEVIDGCSQGLSRMRIYVDPYLGAKAPSWQQVIEHPVHADTVRLFERLAGLSWTWANDTSRLWKHWITDYIDYFGARQWAMQKSYFHAPNSACRISLTEKVAATDNMKAA